MAATGSKTIPSAKMPKSQSSPTQKPLTKSEFREQMAAKDAIVRSKKSKRVDRDFVNPNTVRFIPDRNPNVSVNQ